MPINQSPKRQRGVSLSEDGKIIVLETKGIQHLSQNKLAEKAYVSIATVKRFLKGDNIDRGNFDELCKTLNHNPKEIITPPNYQLDSATLPISRLVSLPPEPPLASHSGTHLLSFMITGTFSPNKLAEIEVALVHLEKLLHDGGTFTLVPEHNYFAVTGTFSEDKKPQAEVALMHLEKLLLEHCITYK